ncbi:hypothetical protein [uncultured Chitinophaga sp.]|jgi:hypothetical protein|uniref:hypothetical protein n=1 Tax=uncultured Chitinophaga sp. TaxID=339340 RepID=UPI002603904B|nr:hypothetical protein [uncultured Chitinophaga sp.]
MDKKDKKLEADRDKHVNFPSLEKDGDSGQEEHPPQDEETAERQAAWKRALDEGKKQRDRP